MPLQSSGIIVVDKTSVITTAPTSVAVAAPGSGGRTNGIFGSLGGGNHVDSGAGVLHNHSIQEWQHGENDYKVHVPNSTHNIIRRNQRSISSVSASSVSSLHQSSTKSATITTIPLSNTAQFNTSQMNQINHHQQQINHQSQQHSRQHQSQPSQHHHQTATVLQSAQPGQVIVSEDFLEHATFSSNSNAAGSANVINLTSDLVNSTQIIKLVSDGSGGNVLIDSLGNVSNGGHLHANSKLLVGNLTVLSKQHNSGGNQPTFNFVNTKGISYLTTTAKNSSAQSQGASQQQIHHIATSGSNVANNNGGSSTAPTMVQKMGVPRNVQVVTRVQAINSALPQSQHSQQQVTQVSQSPAHLQHSLHNNQIIMQQKYVHNIMNTSPMSSGNVNNKVNNSGGILKKQMTSGKISQVKTIVGPGQKSHTHQQQIMQQQGAIQLQAHQQQSHQTLGMPQNTHATIKPVRSTQKVVRKIIGSTVKGSTGPAGNTKYIMQSPIVLTSGTSNQIISNKMPSTNASANNIVVPQQMISTINNPGCNTPAGGAIKFVNAHGAVIQSQPVQNAMQHTNVQQQQLHTHQQPQKVRNVKGQNNQSQQQQHFSQATAAVVTNEGILIPAYVNNSQNPSNGEEVMINGTQMTEEMSARILQSLSQKSIYNSIRQYQSQPSQQQQQKIIQQQQQPSCQSANIAFETPATISSRDYAISKQQGVLPSHQQQSQGVVGVPHQKIISASNIVFEPSNREYGVCKTATMQHHQLQSQPQHQHKVVQQQSQHSLSTGSASTNIVYDTQSTRLHPTQQTMQQQQQQQHAIQHQQHRTTVQHQFQQQQHHHQPHTLPQRRTQSIDRKYGTSQATKRSTDYFKVNTTEILSSHSSSTTFIDNIPLPSPIQRGDNTPALQQTEHDDEIVGEEVRPIPVSTDDDIINALHAIMQDHTYVAAMPIGLPLELYQQQQQQQLQQSQQQQQVGVSGTQHHHQSVELQSQHQQNHVGGVATTAVTSIASSGIYTTSGIVGQANIGSKNSTTIQLTTTNSLYANSNVSGYPFNSTAHHHNQRDDDANSVISNESRHGNDGLDNDLGEETETAPEAEAEDDSITRCICDLDHDDGYMICCDKCSAWQHVDCMGIDRSNIPEEYLCEVCQPRQVDRARAKSLQLLKRKEQTQLLLNAQMNGGNVAGGLLSDGCGQFNTGNLGHDRLQPLMVNTAANSGNNAAPGKKGKLVAGKKKEILKRVKKERSNSKRRESKRTTKRKTKSTTASNDTNASEKQTQSLRQYIENYELAMTNHYSPELRARLLGVTKQMPSFAEQKIARGSHTTDKCTTVPHAGGKILISNLNMQPSSPIIELRGKYMLATQYKNQNPSINMNLQHHNGLQKNQKTPGPFVFFHRLSTDPSVPEICVDTRTYGNEARFVRRSCRPNAEIQHSFEKGTIHLWIVSLTNIMASTEITIRHEPHDLVALDNKQSSYTTTPTSTICACGLTKDCPFATITPPLTIVAISNTKTNNKKVVINGAHLPDGKHAQQQAMPLPHSNVSCKKIVQNSVSRGRSTSSSGESNVGLLSPNGNFSNVYNMASVSMMHDSGVYTSSSSPSVSIPSPTHPQTINSPPQHTNSNINQKPANTQPVEQLETVPITTPLEVSNVSNPITPAKSPQKCSAQIRKTPVRHARNNSMSEDSGSQVAGTATTQSQAQPAEGDKRESRKLTREERKMEAIMRAIEKMEKNQQRKQELKQARNSSVGCKRRNSSSPSPKRAKSQSLGEGLDNMDSLQTNQTAVSQQHMQPMRKTSSGTLPRKKKRKSSKSYQIQSNQRKRRRSRVNSNDSDMLTSEESSSLLSPPLARTTSMPASLPSQEEIAERQKTLLASLSLESSQMASMSSAQQLAQSIKREEVPIPPLQPLQAVQPMPGVPPPLYPIQHVQPVQQQLNQCDTQNIQSSQAAGLLLAFATTTESEQNVVALVRAEEELEHCRSPPRQSHQIPEPLTPQTPPIVSSTCMLVEAAVGPLEGLDILGASGNEFKLPPRTKTKKSIMNDWLNQSSEYQDYQQQSVQLMHVKEEEINQSLAEEYIQHSPSLQHILQQQQQHHKLLQSQQDLAQVGKGIETLVQAAETISEYRRTTSSPAAFMVNQLSEEPKNLSMVAKRVEEFIHQNDTHYPYTDEIKNEPNVVEGNTNMMLPIHVNNNNNCSGSSSVKKRWLRQAISEECSDELANSSAASSPTQMYPVPNGFTTPLKKRRLIRECNEIDTVVNSPEDLSVTRSSGEGNLVVEEIAVSKMEVIEAEEFIVDSKIKIKQEICEVEDEVDILNSPSPDEKIIASDDNLVKIEPEDMNTEIKVDVEKEETVSSNDVAKKTEVLEQVVPINKVDEVKVESPYLKMHLVTSDSPSEQSQLKLEDSPKVKSQILSPKANVKSPKNEPILKQELPANASQSVKTETESKEEKRESVTDEIADIQKRLHSFHTENIMILQSRNKSKIAKSLKQEPAVKCEKKSIAKQTDSKPDFVTALNCAVSEPKGKKKAEKSKGINGEPKQKKGNSIKGEKHKGSKKRKVAEDIKKNDEPKAKNGKKKVQVKKEIESTAVKDAVQLLEAKDFKHQPKVDSINDNKSEPPPLVPTTTLKDEPMKIDEKHLQAALTIPNFNRTLPTTPITNYVLNSVEQSYDISALLSAPPPPPPPSTESSINIPTSSSSNTLQASISSQPPPLHHLPYYYNTIYGKPVSSVSSLSGSLSSLSTSSLLSEYMETTKTKSFSTLGYISHFGLGLSKSSIGSSSLSTPVTTTTTTTASSTDTVASSTTSSSSSFGAGSKILTRTASHDPRLNPILTAPEPPPAPRRKLSINEYRKRKQLSTEPGTSCSGTEKVSNSNANSQGSSSGNSSFENDKYDSASNSNDGSYSDKFTDVSKVHFCPAPTLLEQQQEIICERLKSLKSKAGLCSSSGLSGLQMDGSLTSSMLLSSSSTTPSISDHAATDTNCFSLGKLNDRNEDFSLVRRTLRNNSTSSLESISSTSSRRSSYRGSTPVPQQYDGMDSPRLLTQEDDDAIAGHFNVNNTQEVTESSAIEAAHTITTMTSKAIILSNTATNSMQLAPTTTSSKKNNCAIDENNTLLNHSECSSESK